MDETKRLEARRIDDFVEPGIYGWSIILAETNFFQQSESVLAANFRGSLNPPSTFYQFLICFNELSLNFGILCKHFGTVTQCSVEPTVSVLLTAKPLETSQKPNFW